MRISKRTKYAFLGVCLALAACFVPLRGGTIIQSAYRIIQQAGSPLPLRAILNLTGASCADNPGAGSTDCTISGASVGAVTSVFSQTGAVPNLSGDCTTSNSSVVSCPKTGGVAFSFFSTLINLSGDCTTSGSGVVTCLGSGGANKVKTCVVAIGDPGAASAALANDNDSPVACPNDLGADWTITSVSAWADAGSPTVTPILTGGTATSILSGALTAGTAAWAAGTLNGTPVVHSFSAGSTCSSTPCSIDVNITTAGGTAKYIVVKIVGTRP